MEAIRIITESAHQYHTHLENKNILFINQNKSNYDYIETCFLPRNFMHLTGVIVDKSKISSNYFYKKCLSNALSPKDFDIAQNGTTEMKLTILPQLMKIKINAKMLADYDNTKSVLITQKMIGTVTACMGFVLDKDYYIPNTALKEDIRDITIKPQKRIVLIMEKHILENQYSTVSYQAKNTNLFEVLSNMTLNKTAINNSLFQRED